MTVSAADTAGPALPIAGSAGKRTGEASAEGADVFAALVAGLLGSLVAPDLTGQQDQPGQQGQPGPTGDAVGAIGAPTALPGAGTAAPATLITPVAVPVGPAEPVLAGPAAPDAPSVPTDVSTDVPAGDLPQPGTAPASQAPQAPVAKDVAVAPALPAGPDLAPAQAQQAEATPARTEPLEQPDVPTVTTPPVAAPVATAPAHVVQDVAPAAAVAAPAASAPAAPAVQVAAVVSPVLQGPDGSYRVTMHLHPEELGRVNVTVDLHQGSVSMHLHAAETGTGALLRESLDDLRAELDRQGLSAGSLDVSAGDGGPGGRPTRELPRSTTRTDSSDDVLTTAAPVVAVHPTSGRPSALDVQL